MGSHSEPILLQMAEDHRNLFFGKYRGVVLEALTGDDLGKLKVAVPDVLDDKPGIAWPCVPFAGRSHGFVSVPEANDGVWIEFERGNPAHPIWVGCWWTVGEMPRQADVKVRAWVTTAGLAIVMDDDRQQISLQHPDGPSITLSSEGITLSTNAATITLDAQGISLQGITQVSE
jgi:Type VI secretion system/phage-baseplate injector OB domain